MGGFGNMKRSFFAIAMIFLNLKSIAASNQDLGTFYTGQLADYIGRRSAFFVSECLIDGGWAIILVPIGKSVGIYGEFSAAGLEANGSKVTLLDGNAKLGEIIIGGIATQAREQQIVDALMRMPFEFVASSHVKSVLLGKPKVGCHLASS